MLHNGHVCAGPQQNRNVCLVVGQNFFLEKMKKKQKQKKQNEQLLLSNTDKHKEKLRISRQDSHLGNRAGTNLGRTCAMNDNSFDNSSVYELL